MYRVRTSSQAAQGAKLQLVYVEERRLVESTELPNQSPMTCGAPAGVNRVPTLSGSIDFNETLTDMNNRLQTATTAATSLSHLQRCSLLPTLPPFRNICLLRCILNPSCSCRKLSPDPPRNLDLQQSCGVGKGWRLDVRF